MYKIRILMLAIIVMLCSCCLGGYRSTVRIDDPIRAATNIYVSRMFTTYSEAIGREAILEAFSEKIEQAIINDLEKNVFPNHVNGSALLYVDVQLIAVEVDGLGRGKVLIKCTITDPDDIEIKSYEVEGTSGMKFSITEAAMAATKDAMEKVKMNINEDRDEINNAARGF